MDRIALIVLGIGSPLLVLACLLGGEAGRLTFVTVTPLIPVALIALGASRQGSRGSPGNRGRQRNVAWVLLALTLTLEAGSVGVLLLSRPDDGASLVAGLPAATFVMLVALGVGPLLLIPVSYAVLFEADGQASSAERREASREP
jgi:hypothetical protein